MKNRKIVFVITLIIGIILLTSGIFLKYYSKTSKNNKNILNNNINDKKVEEISFDKAKEIAFSLYKTKDTLVSIEESSEGYKVYVKDIKNQNIKNIFIIDPKNGTIKEEPQDIIIFESSGNNK